MKKIMDKIVAFLSGMLLFTLIAQGFINRADCAELTAGLALDCDYPIVGGARDNIWLMSLSAIASVTRNVTNDQIIEAITMDAGKYAWIFEGKNNSVEPQLTLIKQRYSEVYDHEVMFKVFLNTPDAKLQMEKMVQGKLVAIVQNNHLTDVGSTSFEIYGLSVGLEVAELTRIVADADTQGAYNLILRTSETSKEGHLPNPFFITDYATTLTAIEGLESP